MQFEIPRESYAWLTDEIVNKLRAIRGQHAAKKRATVIKIAFARANEQPLREVFNRQDTCSETIWYTKWRHNSAIKDAYDVCYKRALDWADEETAALETFYRQKRRRSVAELAAQAPRALAAVMNDGEQPGSHRISAANALIGWADPDMAERVRPAAPASNFEQHLSLLAGMSDDELDEEIAREIEARQAAGREAAATPGEIADDDPGGEAAATTDT